MSQQYEVIPDGAKSLYVNLWSCDDSCECNHMEIRVVFGPEHPSNFLSRKDRDWSRRLWEGVWWHSSPDEDCGRTTEEILGELREACLHYEIPLTGNTVWDVKGERVLRV